MAKKSKGNSPKEKSPKKKRLTWILILSITLAVALAVGIVFICINCANKNKDDETVSTDEFKLIFNTYEMSLYDTQELKVINFDDVEWNSSDEKIVSVTESGMITANAYGQAIITAKSGELSDTCTVTVLDEGIVPLVKLNTETDKISLLKDMTYKISPSLSFNNKEYSDFTCKYESHNPSVAKVDENGVITACSYGETNISIVFQWRDFESKYLEKSLTVAVTHDISMEFSFADNTKSASIYSVNETVNGQQYINTASMQWRITLDGVDVTSTASAVIKSSNTSVIEVLGDGVTLQAVNRGTAYVYLVYTYDGEEYYSLPLSISVLGRELKSQMIYNVTENQSFTVNDIQGNVTSCGMEQEELTYSQQSNTVTITPSESVEKGEHIVTVETTKYSYVIDVVFATHVISNAEQFETFTAAYSGGVTSNGTSAWYAVLSNDIDFKGKDLILKTTSDWFGGTFNGLGHSMKNITIVGHNVGGVFANAGLFGRIYEEGVIENFSLIGIDQHTHVTYILTEYNVGKVRNVYVKGESSIYNGNVMRLSCGSIGWGSVENSIFEIEYAEADKGIPIVDSEQGSDPNASFVMNLFMVGNAKSYAGWETNKQVYSTANDLLTAEKDNIIAKNGFSKYWENDQSGLWFNNLLIVDNANLVTERKELEYVSENKQFNLETISGGNVIRVLVNNVKVSDVSNNCFDVDIDDYTHGKTNEITVYTEEKKIIQPFVVATYAISTAQELKELFADVDEENNNSANWYVILTSNIDMQGEVLYNSANRSFAGVLNGLGHAISNLKFGCPTSDLNKGLFGGVSSTAVIENVAFINLQQANGYATNAFSNNFVGKLNNVYIDVKYTNLAYGVINFNYQRGEAHNVIINVQEGSQTGKAAFAQCVDPQWTTNVIENSYVIGNVNFSSLSSEQESRTAYTDVATMLTANKTTIEENFNEYWSFDNSGNLYFGTAKIG